MRAQAMDPRKPTIDDIDETKEEKAVEYRPLRYYLERDEKDVLKVKIMDDLQALQLDPTYFERDDFDEETFQRYIKQIFRHYHPDYHLNANMVGVNLVFNRVHDAGEKLRNMHLENRKAFSRNIKEERRREKEAKLEKERREKLLICKEKLNTSIETMNWLKAHCVTADFVNNELNFIPNARSQFLNFQVNARGMYSHRTGDKLKLAQDLIKEGMNQELAAKKYALDKTTTIDITMEDIEKFFSQNPPANNPLIDIQASAETLLKEVNASFIWWPGINILAYKNLEDKTIPFNSIEKTQEAARRFEVRAQKIKSEFEKAIKSLSENEKILQWKQEQLQPKIEATSKRKIKEKELSLEVDKVLNDAPEYFKSAREFIKGVRSLCEQPFTTCNTALEEAFAPANLAKFGLSITKGGQYTAATSNYFESLGKKFKDVPDEDKGIDYQKLNEKFFSAKQNLETDFANDLVQLKNTYLRYKAMQLDHQLQSDDGKHEIDPATQKISYLTKLKDWLSKKPDDEQKIALANYLLTQKEHPLTRETDRFRGGLFKAAAAHSSQTTTMVGVQGVLKGSIDQKNRHLLHFDEKAITRSRAKKAYLKEDIFKRNKL